MHYTVDSGVVLQKLTGEAKEILWKHEHCAHIKGVLKE